MSSSTAESPSSVCALAHRTVACASRVFDTTLNVVHYQHTDTQTHADTQTHNYVCVCVCVCVCLCVCVGHGVGRVFHTTPNVVHYKNSQLLGTMQARFLKSPIYSDLLEKKKEKILGR
jgi:nitrate/nitrite transporter NarK